MKQKLYTSQKKDENKREKANRINIELLKIN